VVASWDPRRMAGGRGSSFQSPSLRGSGRFVLNGVKLAIAWQGFNPLHCGAVVASRRPPRRGPRRGPRFNPLHCGAVVASRGFGLRPSRSAGFNPLHCGAVVASDPQGDRGDQGRGRFNPLHCGAVVASRGARRKNGPVRHRFNPLHCGAVVASRPTPPRRGAGHGAFQSPSLRGSGRFFVIIAALALAVAVSIPFIAGQWSLQVSRPRTSRGFTSCFNPLHCGAVVASAWRRGKEEVMEMSFNPLHCGAVVASTSPRSSTRCAGSCFNPLHCGAVVASGTRHRVCRVLG